MIPALVVQQQGLGVITADNANTYVSGGAFVADLRGFTGITGMQVYIQGYTAQNDGGQGMFAWNTTSAGPDNGATIIMPYSSVMGAWVRLSYDGLTRAAPQVAVITGGSGTYNTPIGSLYLVAEVQGGGAGGSGSGTGGVAGGAGTTSNFDIVIGTGSSSGPGGRGTGSGGDINIAGGAGSGGTTLININGPSGGSSFFGGAGAGGAQGASGSAAGTNTGAGGGGPASPTTAAAAGGSGGAGGYAKKIISSPAVSYPFTVGTGGIGGTAGTFGFTGGAGAAGIIIVTAYFS